MRRQASLALAIIHALALAGCGSAIRFPSGLDRDLSFHYDLQLEMFQLSNGLTVVLAPARDTNVVVVNTRYEVGSTSDPAGRTGLAHFVEHVTFLERAQKGAPTLTEQLTAAALEQNAQTTEDSTDYISEGLASRWVDLLGVEAARMSGSCASIDDDLLERERGVVTAELAERDAQDRDMLQAAVFGEGHPYAHSPGGSDVAHLTRDDVCAFLADHYSPDHAVLVISGAIDRQVMRQVITATFGGIKAHGQNQVPAVAPFETGKEPEILRSRFERPTVLFAYPAPAWGTDASVDHRVAEEFLREALTTVAEHGKAKAIDSVSVFDLGGQRGGAIVIMAVAKKGVALDAVEKELHDGLRLAARAGQAGADVLRDWHAYLYAGIVDRYEDLWSRGTTLADYLQFTSRHDFHLHDLELSHDVTANRIATYIQYHLVTVPPRVIHVLPDEDAASSKGSSRIAQVAQRVIKDLSIARQPVDLAEADAPLAVPTLTRAQAPTELTLDNGLRVIFAPRLGSSLFEARMIFPVGSADDPKDASGAARLAASLLHTDPYVQYRDERELLDAADYVGTSLDEAVSENTTVFTTSGLASFAQWHLWRLHTPLEAGEYPVGSAERAEKADNDDTKDEDAPRRTIIAKLFGADHPFARRPAHENADIYDLEHFRDAHYVAAGATLIVSGNFDRAVIEKEIRELWGEWPTRKQAAVRTVPPAAPEAGPTVFYRDVPDAAQVHVQVGVLARSNVHEARAARVVAAELMDLRLAAVREEMAASYGVYASYYTTEAGDLLQVSGDLEPPRAGDAIHRILDELTQLRDHTDQLRGDFVRARRTALSVALASTGTASSAADEAEDLVLHDLPIDYFVQFPAKVGAVMPADVATLLHGDLDRSRMVVVISGPGAKALAEGCGLGRATELPARKKK